MENIDYEEITAILNGRYFNNILINRNVLDSVAKFSETGSVINKTNSVKRRKQATQVEV